MAWFLGDEVFAENIRCPFRAVLENFDAFVQELVAREGVPIHDRLIFGFQKLAQFFPVIIFCGSSEDRPLKTNIS